MIRIDDYEQLKTRMCNWIKDYYWKYNIKFNENNWCSI